MKKEYKNLTVEVILFNDIEVMAASGTDPVASDGSDNEYNFDGIL